VHPATSKKKTTTSIDTNMADSQNPQPQASDVAPQVGNVQDKVDAVANTAPQADVAKRPRDDDDGGDDRGPAAAIAPDVVQRDAKKGCDAKGAAVPAAGFKNGLTSVKDPNMFYPETYDAFDPDCVVADGDAQNSKVGGGKMLFIKYMNKSRGVTYPLCVQAPKAFMPAGIMEYKGTDGKINVNALCSLGREWEANPIMVGFRRLCDKLQSACARLIMNKGINIPYCATEAAARDSVVPFVSVTEKADPEDPNKLIVFPPSYKLVINTAGNNRTLLVTRTAQPDGSYTFGEVSYQEVSKGATMVPMIQFNWIYRRKRTNPNGYLFSIHGAAHQGVVEFSGDAQSSMSDRTRCLSIIM
jgi:hypothetical protein